MNWLGYFVLITLYNYFKGQDPGLILVFFMMLSIYHEYLGYNNLQSEGLYAMAVFDSLLQHCTVNMTWTQQTSLILY